jgi:hypothetical protein
VGGSAASARCRRSYSRRRRVTSARQAPHVATSRGSTTSLAEQQPSRARQRSPAEPSSAYRAGLWTIVSASAAPYGYTITVWRSGAVVMHSHGQPSVGDVFLFLVGALLAFSLLGGLAHGTLGDARSIDRGEDRVLAGTLDWVSVGAAVGAAALLANIHGWVVWPLGSFCATLAFLLGTGLQLAVIAARRRHRQPVVDGW